MGMKYFFSLKKDSRIRGHVTLVKYQCRLDTRNISGIIPACQPRTIRDRSLSAADRYRDYAVLPLVSSYVVLVV